MSEAFVADIEHVPAEMKATTPVVELTEQTLVVVALKLLDPVPEPPLSEIVTTVPSLKVTAVELAIAVTVAWLALH